MRVRRSMFTFTVIVVAILTASGVAVAATIAGDSTANDITGTAEADSLYGNGGDDVIRGGSAADRIFGGDNNDKLFGTDEHQSGLNDGNKTSTDGNDRIEGERGDDWVVGASGADTLRGGAGSDTILEGPSNDAAQDTIDADPTFFGTPPPESATWNDKINSASSPAAKDIVNCGPGADQVQADTLDVVNGDCEDVERLNPVASQSTPEVQSGEPPPPMVVSTEGDGPISTETEGGTPPLDTSEPPPEGSGDPSAQAPAYGYDPFDCLANPYYRGKRWCEDSYLSGFLDHLDVVLQDTDPDGRWIRMHINRRGSDWWNNKLFHEVDRPRHTMVYGTRSVYDIYAKTSCWSACWKHTPVNGVALKYD